MNVTLVHTLYGAKIAINEAEIVNDEKNGWTRYNPETPPEVKRPRRRVTVEQPNGATAPASEESEGT
jgi:hypothetical protein